MSSTWGDQPIVYRRSLRALAGVVLSSDEVDGSTEGSFRVDAESALLTPFAFLVPTGEGLPSTFRLLRVDGAHDTVNLANGAGSITCDDVRAHTDELLARAPPPATPSGCATF